MAKIDLKNPYKEEEILLEDIIKLSEQEQKNLIEDTLNTMYESKVKITNSMILKCLKLTFTKNDDYAYLPNRLTVEKFNNKITFKFEKKGNLKLLIMMFSFVLIIGLIFATYSGLILIERSKINIDLDGDGIADLNIDVDGDFVADINIDLNNNKIPDLNINYKGNLKPVFNLDTTGDGKSDFNLVTDATTEAKRLSCVTNCDLNGDGWPNINIDLDGDGIPDLDIDTDQDGIPDLNIDLDGDGICDIMCDTTGDGTCDTNCIETEGHIKSSGPSGTVGTTGGSVETKYLSVIYDDDEEFYFEGLFPEDQPGITFNKEAIRTFKVINSSSYTVAYNVSWSVDINDFISENFIYQIESTNGGLETDGFIVAPKENYTFPTLVLILPNTVQEYTLTFKIRGVGEEQNYDQGKTFGGHINIGT